MKCLLIANRGEIAVRIAATARRMGIRTVAIYSDADDGAPHVRAADVACRVGPAPARDSYLDIDAVLAAAEATGADAVHPGYGFLAESPEFAERCTARGLTFVGPSAEAMRALGDKAHAKRLLEGHGVPFLPGYHGADQSDATLAAAAARIGYPLMIKASAGGGGRGMRFVAEAGRFEAQLRSARSEALAAFGSADVLLERALLASRHVEVQVFGDARGNVVHLGERDCSIQRRHQKLIEESPSPAVDDALRKRLTDVALAVARATRYSGAGTVEFLLDADGAFYFIEMNTRLQVEHGVTEARTGVDLVEWQLRIARGEPLPLAQDEVRFSGHAIEARLCAEDPARDFLPQAGVLVAWEAPAGVRVDHALAPGITISPYYDSMLAKIIVSSGTRADACRRLALALETCVALGVPTNAAALVACIDDETFAAGNATTAFVDLRQALLAGHEPPADVVVLAAALAFAVGAERGAFGSWTAWSSSRLPASIVRISLDERPERVLSLAPRGGLEVTVSLDAAQHAIAFADFDSAGGRARYRADGGPWRRLAFACNATSTYFTCDGRAYRADERSGEAAAPATASGDGFIRAPMSGRIVDVLGRAGDALKAGASLAVVEAMKMEHVVTLPVDAVLRTVAAAIGKQVHASDVLFEYDPATRF